MVVTAFLGRSLCTRLVAEYMYGKDLAKEQTRG